MSALGEYVYLNKKNYFNNNHNSTKNKIHYQENIFSDHKENIIKSIKAVDMENMENKYNNVLEKTFDSFNKLFTKASEIDRANFLKYLLKDSTLANHAKLDEIISKIEVDKDRMLLTYNPHGI
jgi:triphosphoribosyl-dephospho-CoA synthetase